MTPKSLELGLIRDTGEPLSISQKTRSTHLHIIGPAGEGESKFTEHLIRNLNHKKEPLVPDKEI